jgi:NADPH:quinone reductase-like Zn-dependent oxidoreductase
MLRGVRWSGERAGRVAQQSAAALAGGFHLGAYMPPISTAPGAALRQGGSRMKAVVVEHQGEKGALKDVPTPEPSERSILVRVTAASVNPVDWKLRDRGGRPLPFVLGQDFAGVVSVLGRGVSKYKEGERVFGIARTHGAFAEYTIAFEDKHAEPIAKIPDAVGDADAASFPTAGLTALAAIEWLRVASGTAFFVNGVTGGVGSFAAQIARDRGARVIGTARSDSESFARELGVEEFIAYDREDVFVALKAAHPKGVDAVLDVVSNADTFKKLADVVHADGRIVSTIGSANVDWFAQHNIAAQSLVMAETPQSSHAGLRTLLELLEQERIRVFIADERPLAEAVDALEESKRGSVNGKIVITVD